MDYFSPSLCWCSKKYQLFRKTPPNASAGINCPSLVTCDLTPLFVFDLCYVHRKNRWSIIIRFVLLGSERQTKPESTQISPKLPLYISKTIPHRIPQNSSYIGWNLPKIWRIPISRGKNFKCCFSDVFEVAESESAVHLAQKSLVLPILGFVDFNCPMSTRPTLVTCYIY